MCKVLNEIYRILQNVSFDEYPVLHAAWQPEVPVFLGVMKQRQTKLTLMTFLRHNWLKMRINFLFATTKCGMTA